MIRVAAAVILDADDRMLVVRKRGTALFMQPGGKIMAGESAVEALHREVVEELGVAACSVQPLGRHVADAANESGPHRRGRRVPRAPRGEPSATSEIDEIAWVDPRNPGCIDLAPLTERLSRAGHCGSRTSTADS